MKIDFKTLFRPGRPFEEKTRTRFLAAFDARYPAPRPSRFVVAAKVFSGALAFCAVSVGAVSAYADTTNVPVGNPLYPLKRAAESVELALAPPTAKPELQATFATRRAAEITDLETQNPTSTLLPGLAADLATDVNDSIAAAARISYGNGRNGNGENGNAGNSTTTTATSTATTTANFSISVGTGTPASGIHEGGTSSVFRSGREGSSDFTTPVASVCKTLQSVFGSTSSLVQSALTGRNRAFAQFESACGNASSSGGAVTAPPSIEPFPSSTLPRPFKGDHRGWELNGAPKNGTGTTTINTFLKGFDGHTATGTPTASATIENAPQGNENGNGNESGDHGGYPNKLQVPGVDASTTIDATVTVPSVFQMDF